MERWLEVRLGGREVRPVQGTEEMGEADEKWGVGRRSGLCPILSMGGCTFRSLPSPTLGLSEDVVCKAPRGPLPQPK